MDLLSQHTALAIRNASSEIQAHQGTQEYFLEALAKRPFTTVRQLTTYLSSIPDQFKYECVKKAAEMIGELTLDAGEVAQTFYDFVTACNFNVEKEHLKRRLRYVKSAV